MLEIQIIVRHAQQSQAFYFYPFSKFVNSWVENDSLLTQTAPKSKLISLQITAPFLHPSILNYAKTDPSRKTAFHRKVTSKSSKCTTPYKSCIWAGTQDFYLKETSTWIIQIDTTKCLAIISKKVGTSGNKNLETFRLLTFS